MPLFDPRAQLKDFLAEDVGCGDVTSELLPDTGIDARIVTREDAVVSGAAHALEIFRQTGCAGNILRADGTSALAGDVIMAVSGRAADVLACERTALNLLARMSGIATQTKAVADSMAPGVALYSTRKTAPGLRYFDKEAVEAGGGHRHRLGLDEMVMIKDNHIAAGGSLREMVRKARKMHARFEVEVENADDAVIAVREGAPLIMLDNFSPDAVREALRELESEGLRDGVVVEASGGITPGNAAEYSRTGVDAISMGSITCSARCIDVSLEI